MQEESGGGKKKFHINGYGDYVKVGRAKSSYDWMFITGYRNELISALQAHHIVPEDWLFSIQVGEHILYQSSWSISYQYSEFVYIEMSPEWISVYKIDDNGNKIEDKNKSWKVTEYYTKNINDSLIDEIQNALKEMQNL